MIRRATAEDVDFLLGVASACYDDFDIDASRKWLLAALENPAASVWRGEHSGGVATVTAPFYRPSEIRGFMMFIASTEPHGGEGMRLLRAMVAWARTMGAKTFRFGSGTEVDLSPIARRIGAKEESPSYTLEM